MTESDGQMKGSARSISAFHITNFFGSIKDSFISYGGHKAAAGFTIQKETLEDFKKLVLEKVETMLNDTDLERVIEVDLKIPIDTVSLHLAKDLEILNPFGIGNPQPTFVSDVVIQNAQLFGKSNDHLKLFVKNSSDSTNSALEIIAFGKAEMFNSLSRDQKIQLVYQLDINRWNSRESLRGKLVDFLPILGK
jgi:single-stranded-DNA-specific exonuclease